MRTNTSFAYLYNKDVNNVPMFTKRLPESQLKKKQRRVLERVIDVIELIGKCGSSCRDSIYESAEMYLERLSFRSRKLLGMNRNDLALQEHLHRY